MTIFYETTALKVFQAQQEGKDPPQFRSYEPLGPVEFTKLMPGTLGFVRLPEGHPMVSIMRAAHSAEHPVLFPKEDISHASFVGKDQWQRLKIVYIMPVDADVVIYVEAL